MGVGEGGREGGGHGARVGEGGVVGEKVAYGAGTSLLRGKPGGDVAPPGAEATMGPGVPTSCEPRRRRRTGPVWTPHRPAGTRGSLHRVRLVPRDGECRGGHEYGGTRRRHKDPSGGVDHGGGIALTATGTDEVGGDGAVERHPHG